MPVRLNSTGGGSVTLDVPSTASTFTATVPANTGTLVTTGSTAAVTQGMLASGVAGNGPAFRAFRSSNQSISSNTFTKVQFNSEVWDTNNAYDNTTNYRFQPAVAGYYLVSWSGGNAGSNTPTYTSFRLFKNGSADTEGASSSGVNAVLVNTSMVYLNGSTDYIEIYAYITAASAVVYGASDITFVTAALVRAA